METVTDFIFLDSKITVDGDHSHEIKRCLLLGRKATMMLKLRLQYFDHYMRRTDSLEKIRVLGSIEGRRIRGWQRMRWLDGITNTMDMGLGDSESWWWIGRPGMLRFMGLQRVGHYWATELNWTKDRIILLYTFNKTFPSQPVSILQMATLLTS